MKLTHVTLGKFRSAMGLELPLDAKRILIAGVNGVGKSNVREAIRWALTGHCDYTDAKGAGAEVLIPEQERVAEVICTIDSVGALARTYSVPGGGTVAIAGWTGTGQIQQQALYGKLGTIPEYLDAVLHTENFLRLGHADSKAMVLGLLQVSIPVRDKSYTLDQLEQAYKVAFADRTVAKKQVTSFFAAPAPGPETTPPVEAIKAQLEKLRTALGEQHKAVGAVVSQRAMLTHTLQSMVEYPDQGEDPAPALAQLEAQIAELEAAAVPAASTQPNTAKPISVLRSQAVALEAHHPDRGCVIDGTVSCHTKRSEFELARDAVISLVAKRISDMEVVPEENPLTTARNAWSALRSKQRERTATLKAIEHQKAVRADIEAQLAKLPDTAEQEAALKATQARIAKGEALLGEAQQYAKRVAEDIASRARRASLEAEVKRLELLVDELGPKGARVKALGEAMRTFEAAVNPYMDPFGWRITIKVEPWEVYANKRPVSTYSKSEQYRIGIALQLAIAMLSGLKFAIIDELDMLDVANRKLTTGMILASPLEQVIVIGTREVEQALPVMPGVKAYRLAKKDGLTVIAETAVPKVVKEAVTA